MTEAQEVRARAKALRERREELEARPLYRRLLDEGLFRRLVIIERAGRERRYQVVELC